MNNDNNITGINVNEVRKVIEELYNKGVNHIAKKMGEKSIKYFGELKYTWCSNKAIDFYNNHAEALVNTINNISEEIIKLCKKIENSHNIYAKVNNSELITVQTDKYVLLSLPTFIDNLNGISGMNIEKVKEYTKEFRIMMTVLIDQIYTLPYKIGLFDPNYEQAKAYKHTLYVMQEKIEKEVHDILSAIDEAIQNETNEVRLTKEYAESVLGN